MPTIMTSMIKLSTHLNHLCEGLGYVSRHQPLVAYCSGLMLTLERNSVEPMAAAVDPQYYDQLGKKTNCQVAVSLSIANGKANLPIDYRLYLPMAMSH